MKKLTNEIVDQRLIGRNIKRLDEYVGKEIKINFQCLVAGCNYIWGCKPGNIFNGNGCVKCSNLIKLTNEIVDERLKNRNIIRLTNIISTKTKTKFQCLICNYIWESRVSSVISDKKCGCIKCSKLSNITNEMVDDKLKNRNIKRLENYINEKTKINFKCLIEDCNIIWATAPDNIFNGCGCPGCCFGKNENIVNDILINNNINFERHVQIKKIINAENRNLKIDFYFPKIKTIIEYNGPQHYRPVTFGGCTKLVAKSNFIKQQDRDLYLQQICDANNIKLIWIDGRKFINSKLANYVTNDIIPMINDRNNL